MAATSILPDTLNKNKSTSTGIQTGVQPIGTTSQAQSTQQGYNQVPYMQENTQNQLIPLSQDAINQGKVIQQAATTALEQPIQSETQNLVQQQTQNLLNDPYQGLDVEGYKQNQLDQFNRAQSQAMEAARQSLGATSQSGELQNEFLKNMLYGAQQRADLSAQTDYDLSALKQQRLIDALAAGREGVETEQSALNNYINNLATVSGLYEPALERQWETSERLGAQDFESIQNNLDRELQQAIADQDDQRIRDLQTQSDTLALKMQTNEMDHEESMAYLNSELENAKADNDVEREKTILTYSAKLQAEEDVRNYGYETALTNLRGSIDKEIAAGNNASSLALLQTELEYKTNKDIEDRALEQARIDLEEIGVDMNVFDSQVAQITSTYGEEAAQEYIASTLKEQGVDMSAYDIVSQKEAALTALKEEFTQMQEQFALSHSNNTELVQNGELTAKGLEKFDEYYNYTMYGELTEEQQEEKRTAGYLDETDILTAMAGDKFKITTPYKISTTGVSELGIPETVTTIPPGEYSVKVTTNERGYKIFGTYQTYDEYYLVDKDGNSYLTRIDFGSKKGYF